VTHDLDEALYLSDRVLLMTPTGRSGAGRIAREIIVDTARPRDRRHLTLAQLRGELLEGLGELVSVS
jgi:sulfonate transport system ATP-binding protein